MLSSSRECLKPARCFTYAKINNLVDGWVGCFGLLCCVLIGASGCSTIHPVHYPHVHAVGQTTPVANADDAADDPAIWVNPTTPSESLIMGTDKQVGLVVYDLEGRTVQSLSVGRLNNVDVRQEVVMEGGNRVDIAAASHRDAKGVSVFVINGSDKNRPLWEVAGSPFATGVLEPYGLCMARLPGEAGVRVFVNDKNGLIEEWHFEFSEQATETGGRLQLAVRSKLVAARKLGSQVEGMVADEETGLLFVGEEAKGIWSFPLNAAQGTQGTLIASTSGRYGLRADVEGLAIARTGTGEGYLLCSSQGDNTFAVFERTPPHEHVGSFVMKKKDEGSPGSVEETDGIEVFVGNLGPLYPDGLFVAQDGQNQPQNQNFKMAKWSSVVGAIEECKARRTAPSQTSQAK